MNDVRIADLMRMAVEADEMERDAFARDTPASAEEAPPARAMGGRRAADGGGEGHEFGAAGESLLRRWRLIAWLSGGLAAAACVGLFAGVVMLVRAPGNIGQAIVQSVGPGKSLDEQRSFAGDGGGLLHAQASLAEREGEGRQASAGVRLARLPGSSEEQCCVVVALVRDESGALGCVRWRQHDWDINRVSGMNAMDLKTAVSASCGTPGHGGFAAGGGERQVVLVAIAGPTSLLPRTDEDAADLALCILGSPRPCETEGMCFTGAAARCLPDELSVKVETVALR